MASYSSEIGPGLNLDPITQQSLVYFDRRRRWLLLLRSIAAGVIVFVAAMTVVAICDYFWLLSAAVRWGLSAVGYAATVFAVWHFGLNEFRSHDPRRLARQMQTAAPNLRDDLLSAVELADPNDANGSPVFRERLQGRVARRISALDVGRLLPVGLIQRWLSTGVGVAAICVILMLIPSMQFGRRFARAMLPGAPIQRASRTQVDIIEPSPASGYVAEGDAVGVVVKISGEPANDVVMHWRTDDGVSGETIMSPRVRPESTVASGADGEVDSPSGLLQTGDLFAGNLSVGTVPVQYQIHAGDAITLWHELTPLPRPRVAMFTKRYVFPSYAKLSDRVEEDDHGDLQAIVGTMGEISVRFDEPVQNAMVRFGNGGAEIEMQPLDQSGLEFAASIPIKTACQYQVDATSVKSGLNNPFSATYTVTPVIDTPPVARWSSQMVDMALVSPLAVLELSGVTKDDLPVDRIYHEFRINGGQVQDSRVPVSQPAREMNPQWQWDLIRRLGDGKETPKLSGGDVIQTRFVAIDRRGSRGESKWIDLLIAEDGFQADRHHPIDALHGLASQVIEWSKSALEISDQLKTAGAENQLATLEGTAEKYEPFHQSTSKLLDDLAVAMELSGNVSQTNSLELLARSILAMDTDLDLLNQELTTVLSTEHDAWKTQRQRLAKQLSYEAQRTGHQAGRVDSLARGLVSQALSLGVARDAVALRRSLRVLTSESGGVPVERFGRHMYVTLGRIQTIDDLVSKHGDVILDSTKNHFEGEGWRRWAERWTVLLQRTIEDSPAEKQYRETIRRFESELQQKIGTALSDGRLSQLYNEAYRDLRRNLSPYRDLVDQVQRHGSSAQAAREKATKAGDASAVAEANLDAKYHGQTYTRQLSQLVTRLGGESDLHRRRPRVDLNFAADLNLLRRAIENVNQEGYQPYRDESANDVHRNLSNAIQILEAIHEANLCQFELLSLIEAERSVDDTPESRLENSIWMDRFSLAFEWPVRHLQESKLDWNSLLETLDQTRYNGDHNAAKERISRRRWDKAEPVSAEVPLSKLNRQLEDGLGALQPNVLAAREMIQRYVLTLPEQARQAAAKAQQAQQRTEERSDASQETTDHLDEQQQEAEQAARETVDLLIDKANTSDITDDQERELARDADAAAAAVKDAVDQAETEMENASNAADEADRSESLEKAEQALEKLAQTLEQTADHFERAENGQDVSESRQQLREAERELQIAQDLQERYDEAEQMASAANMSPEDLLQQLERELKTNQPMQEELSEISEDAAESAQTTLEQAAKDERSLNQSLERTDPALEEEKRRTAQALNELTRRADAVQNHLLPTSRDAAGWANDPKTRELLEKAREDLVKAGEQVKKLGGKDALADEMQKAAAEMKKAVENVAKATQQAQKQSEQTSQKEIHNDERARKNSQNSMENKSKTLRNRLVQEMNRSKLDWSRVEREAGQRIQQAQRQERDAKNARQRAEDQLKKDENNQGAKDQLREQQQREQAAKRAEDAAEKTRDFAREARKRVEDQSRQLQRQRQEPLNRPNPAGQLAEQTAKQAASELKEIQEQLADLAKQIDQKSPLQTSEKQADQLADQQQRINDDVDNAAEQVARAARHEERLGQETLAEKLDQMAQAINDNGAKAAEDARKALEAAADDSAKAGEAAEKVSQAQDKIGQDAKRLAEMLEQLAQNDPAADDRAEGDPTSSESSQGEPTQSQQSQAAGSPAPPSSRQGEPQDRARQLAQTLDELDQAIAEAAKQAQQMQAQQGNQPTPSDDSAGQTPSQPPQANSQPNGQQQAAQGQRSADASQTLSQMLDAQRQQSAKQRQQQLGQGQPGQSGQPQQSDEQNPGEPKGDTMGDNAGPGQPPGGEGILAEFNVGDLGQWGQLRERKTDDAAESRSAQVAPQYRRELEAYFRAIAERAADKAEQ
ncbi:MAG: hypothetical protein HKN47_05455 [Pirellulaceae bacterium]|nr:hypothetical protein [Pirellulaceae bacterium]